MIGDRYERYLRAFGVSILLIVGLSWILVDAAVIFAGAIGFRPWSSPLRCWRPALRRRI